MAGENENASNETVNPEIQMLQVIATFLGRVDLKGTEVPAFNAAINYLQGKAQEISSSEQPEIVTGAPLPNVE